MDTPIDQAGAQPRPLTSGQRAGIWIGFHGWLFGFVIATMPDTGSFLGPLIGGWMLTLVLIFAFEALARRTSDQVIHLGSVGVAVGLILTYYSLAIEPEIVAHPPALQRLESLSAVTHCPVWVGASIAAAGAIVLLFRAVNGPRAA